MSRVHWGLMATWLFGLGVNQALAAGEVAPPPTNAAEASVAEGTDPKVIWHIAPMYPQHAAINTIEGRVELEFFVEMDGSTSNIKPIVGVPTGTFEKVSVAAVSMWRYKPGTQDGTNARQSTEVTLTFELADSAPSRKFLKLVRKASLDIQSNDFKGVLKNLKVLEKKYSRLLRERELINGLYADYYVALSDNLRAIHRLREANHFSAYKKNKTEKDERLSALFELEMTEGHFAAALNTYSTLVKRKVELSPTDDAKASELRASIEAGSQLTANVMLLGNCHKCRRGAAMWSHRLSYNSFHLADIDGKVTTLKLACDYHWETFSKVPNTLFSIPSEWGECQMRVKGKTGTTFTLLEN